MPFDRRQCLPNLEQTLLCWIHNVNFEEATMDGGKQEDSQEKRPRSIEKRISNFLEPAIILTLLSAELYVMGYAHASGYFIQLGFFISALDLPTTYFISIAIRPALVVALPFVFSMYAGRYNPPNILSSLVGNLFLLGTCLVCISEAMLSYQNWYRYAMLCVAGLLFPTYVVLSWLRRPYLNDLLKKTWLDRTRAIIIVFGFLFIASFTLGKQTAIGEIERSGITTISIEFKWKNAPPTELQGKELNLIIYRDKKYYVVPFERPAPSSPRLFIINEDQIDYAVTHRVN